MYTHCYILLRLCSCICSATRGHTWAASVLLVLMWIGPARLHVYSRLTTSPSSVDVTVYRCLLTLLVVTVWLGCPRFGSLAWSSEFAHAQYSVTSIVTRHDKAAMTRHISLITSFLFSCEGRLDSLALIISVGNTSYKWRSGGAQGEKLLYMVLKAVGRGCWTAWAVAKAT